MQGSRWVVISLLAAALLTPLPAQTHRIGVRAIDGVGEFYDTVNGQRFTPRGNAYTRLTPQLAGGQMVTLITNFNVGLYDAPRSEAALATMQADGYNAVKVWLDPCCDPPDQTGIGSNVGPGLSTEYMANLADFVKRAAAHGIYVFIVADDIPLHGGYEQLFNPQYCVTSPAGTQTCDYPARGNFAFTTPGGVDANAQFWRDVVAALKAQGAPLEAVIAYEVREEVVITPDHLPFSLTSGTLTTPNGKSYDLSSTAQKEQAKSDALLYFASRMRAAIRAVDPQALVGIGFVSQTPYPALGASDADFIDIHNGPGEGDTVASAIQGWKVSTWLNKPLIFGEYGARRATLATASLAEQALEQWQVDSCRYHFSGWLLWAWDTPPEEQVGPPFWMATDMRSVNFNGLAPASRPDPCTRNHVGTAPMLAAIGPASAVAGSSGLQIAVSGRDFVPGAQVLWNGAARPTTFINSTTLLVQISAADLLGAGSASITVRNAASTASNALTFTATSTQPPTSVVPAAAQLRYVPHLVTGAGFVTKLTITNLVAANNAVTVNYVSQSGTLISSTPYVLAPAATLRIETPEADRFGGSTTKWAIVGSDQAIGVNLFFEFNGPSGSRNVLNTIGFNDSPPDTDFTIPVEFQTDGAGEWARTVGLALANTVSAATTVNLKLVDSAGRVIAATSLQLAPYGQTAVTISTLPAFADALPVENFVGVMAVSATARVSAIALGDDFGPFYATPAFSGRAR